MGKVMMTIGYVVIGVGLLYAGMAYFTPTSALTPMRRVDLWPLILGLGAVTLYVGSMDE